MMKLHPLGALFFLLWPLAVSAQLHVETLQSPDAAIDTRTFKVPKVVGTPIEVADRINLWLQYTQLEVIPGHYKKSPFDNVGQEDSGTTRLDYEVTTQTPNLLSFNLSGEYMGAYPSGSRSTVNFDLASGRPIVVEDLFTPLGFSRFSKRAIVARLKTIDDFVTALGRSGGSDGGLDADEKESQRRQYQECRAGYIASGPRHDQLVLAQDHLTVSSDCGFPHVIQALDDLGSIEHSQTYVAMDRDLNPYGHCLLVERRTDCKIPLQKLHVGVYRGSIAAHYPITLLVTDNGYSLQALYFYDRIGNPMSLTTTAPGPNHARMELPAPGSQKSAAAEVFELVIQGDGSLQGTWAQPGKSPLPVTLR